MGEPIKIKTDLKAGQSLPFIEKIAKMDGLRSYLTRDFNWALNKFRMLLIICEQNGLQYWVNRDLRIANMIFLQSLDSSTGNNIHDITLYKN